MHKVGWLVVRMQRISTAVLAEKYAKGRGKTADGIFRRVAHALARCEQANRRAHEQLFLRALHEGFIGGGRIMASAGIAGDATLINCFVQPIGDDIDLALREATETMRCGGGVGYNFSPVPPQGTLGAGPVACIERFDSSRAEGESAGARRGAQMAVLDCDHPDILRFVHAKDRGGVTRFNLSVGVSDAFMQAVQDDGDWELVHAVRPALPVRRRGEAWVYETIRARALWDEIMRATWDHAEPGVLFFDRINRDNNLSYLERIAATNPCGEQPLPDYAGCCLGSINLTRLVRDPFTPDARIDWDTLAFLAEQGVRMLDNVLDLTHWPLEPQRREAQAKRRIGLGVTGLGDALVMLGLRYDRSCGRAMAVRIARTLRNCAYLASVELARERGAFPVLDTDRYLAEPAFASRLPVRIKAAIRRNGIRNSHLLSIAPTGTISLAFADNASNGIEPAFSWRYVRRKLARSGAIEEYPVEDHAWRVWQRLHRGEPLPPAFVSALEISPLDHVRMVAAVQPYIDSAISKTVNVPEAGAYADFRDLYLQAWRLGLKGITSYRPNCVVGTVLLGGGVSCP